jgi:uncharacterized protein YyaL (SSP411 family)
VNRLATEASPYLRDHAENPVDWYPWGKEALARARAENRPIFLSIGYSACHWCHVMARESFSDKAVAAILNDNFVSIKVDREERPDLDEIYIEAIRVMTGTAGWPLSVFLTPELRPFYGGTYFPPEPRPGLAAFNRVLLAVLHYFRTERHEIDEAGNRIVVELNRLSDLSAHEGELGPEPLQKFYEQRLDVFDSEHGGFGIAPKFPNPTDLSLLLRLSGRPGFDQARHIAELTLRKMAEGGIYDQLGGGFHRYSTDTIWLVPHFEKMLYDNALLSQAYALAFRVTEEDFYRSVAEDTLAYMERELLLPGGGFAAAQDADTDGREGGYYVWTAAQVKQAVGDELYRLACDFHGVSEPGHFEGANVPHNAVPVEQLLHAHNLQVAELWPRLAEVKQKLLSARARRTPLGRDDKVLADWNGLALSAFARCGRIFGNDHYIAVARSLSEFLLTSMVRDGELTHFRKSASQAVPGQLPDYAMVVQGLLDAYEAGYEATLLDPAVRLAEKMIEYFADPAGGFFTTRSGEPDILSRIKNGFDGAIPSGNSVAVCGLLRLARLCGRNDFERTAAAAIRRFYETMTAHPSAFSLMLGGLDLLLHPGTEVALFLPSRSEAGDAMAALLAVRADDYYTAAVVKASEPDGLTRRLIPLTDGRTAIDGKPTAYVCCSHTCFEPVHSAEALEALLNRH